jgi:hypothetical protein
LLSAKETSRPRPRRSLTLTLLGRGTKQATLRRRLGPRTARLPGRRRGVPKQATTARLRGLALRSRVRRSTATPKETATRLRLVRSAAAAKEAPASTCLLLLLGLVHRRIAEEAPAATRLRLSLLRRRPTAATENSPASRLLILRAWGGAAAEKATPGWLSSSIACTEEARACVLAWCCAWLRAKQCELRARCARARPSVRRR